MGFFSSLWGKNSENGKNTQNNTPTVQQPRMTEAQRHDAFVQSLRENTANGKYGPVPTQSTARKAAAGSSEDGGRDRGDDPGAPGSQGRESGLKFGTSKSAGVPGWVRAAAAAAEDMGPAATAATAAAGMAVIAAATTMAGAEIVFRVFPTAAQPAGLSVV